MGMIDRDLNPLESRQMRLSARFKAAWAFHQLLVGMERMGAIEHFENKSSEFQSLYSRLRELSDSSHDPTAGRKDLDPRLLGLKQEIGQVIQELDEADRRISPSGLRLFFQQIRSLDERILIEIVRFYIEIQKGKKWESDRLDKADYVLSRLSELVAGPGLKGDRTRLDKVLGAISSGIDFEPLDDSELQQITEALKDQRSEVRWIKTFEELNKSGRIDLYRALKHEMGSKIFYPTVLPLIVEVNSSFRTRIDELRDQAETRLVDEFQRLSQLHKSAGVAEDEVTDELDRLEGRVEEFRSRVKESNIRLVELVDLSRDIDDIAERFESRFRGTEVTPAVESVSSGTDREPLTISAPHALVPDIELLQPFWSELFSGLSSLGEELSPEQVAVAPAVAGYRLEVREVVAFRRLVGDGDFEKVQEQFILAAAVVRWRILQIVAQIRDLLRDGSGSVPPEVLSAARETCRIGDAYVKYYSHLIDQSVFESQGEIARSFQSLQTRLIRDLSGLMILVPRLSS